MRTRIGRESYGGKYFSEEATDAMESIKMKRG